MHLPAVFAVKSHNLHLVSDVDLGPATPPNNFQLTSEKYKTGMFGLGLGEIVFLETNNNSKLLNLCHVALYFLLGSPDYKRGFEYLVCGLLLHMPPMARRNVLKAIFNLLVLHCPDQYYCIWKGYPAIRFTDQKMGTTKRLDFSSHF